MAETNADLVSVIIPTYNRLNLLLEAIDSVRRQTWPHVQIVVADDGSTDGTQEVVSKFKDVCYVRQQNRGQAAARNLGLKYVEGAFVCSLDSDDIWFPDFIERSVQAIRKFNTDIVFDNWTGVSSAGNYYLSYFQTDYDWTEYAETDVEYWRLMEPKQTRDLFIKGCVSPSSSLLMKREFIMYGWTETFKIADDWCMLLDAVLAKPRRVAFYAAPLWYKRVAGDNIYDERDFIEVKRDFYIHDFHLFVSRFKSQLTRQEKAFFHGRLAFHEAGIAGWYVGHGKVGAACRYLAQSVVSGTSALLCSPALLAQKAVKIGKRTLSRDNVPRGKTLLVTTTLDHPLDDK